MQSSSVREHPAVPNTWARAGASLRAPWHKTVQSGNTRHTQTPSRHASHSTPGPPAIATAVTMLTFAKLFVGILLAEALAKAGASNAGEQTYTWRVRRVKTKDDTTHPRDPQHAKHTCTPVPCNVA